MFCPKCGAQNRTDQKFCRNCGQSLPAVRLALEGKVDEAVAELKQAVEKLGSGLFTLSIFILLALINYFLWDEGMLINLLLGVIITGRWIYRALDKADKARKLLELQEKPKDPTQQSAFEAPDRANAALQPVPDTDPNLSSSVPDSVIEHTTLKLKEPEPQR